MEQATAATVHAGRKHQHTYEFVLVASPPYFGRGGTPPVIPLELAGFALTFGDHVGDDISRRELRIVLIVPDLLRIDSIPGSDD